MNRDIRLPNAAPGCGTTLRALSLAFGIAAIASAPLSAQTIGLNVLDSGRVQVAPGAKLAVPLRVDLSTAGGATVAALQGALTWSANRLTFDSLRVVSSTGFSLTANTANAGTGSVSFNAFGTSALAASGSLAMAYFTAGSGTGGTLLTLAPTIAGSEAGADILGLLRVRNLGVCVAPTGAWGDANDDGAVNVIDAQQIARFSVGLSVANSPAILARGDVTADGAVNVIDAQQIARFSVALSAAARVNTALYTPPAVASLALSPSGAQSLLVGATVVLTAEPRDAANTSLAGCRPVTWTSSNPAVATVSSTGLVAGVGPGSTVITGSANGTSVTAALSVVAPAVNVPLQRVLLSAGGGHTCQLQAATGAIDCWGNNNVRQLGNGSTVSVQTSASRVQTTQPFVSVAAGAAHTCALTEVGDVYCWGVGTGAVVPTLVGGGTRFKAIAAGGGGPSWVYSYGESFSCGLTVDGAAYCWGANPYGQLGTGDKTSSDVPRAVSQGTNRYVHLVAGNSHACAISSASTIHCWGGDNPNGALGYAGDPILGPGPAVTLPADAGRPVQLIAGGGGGMGQTYSCALTEIGRTYCWGSNGSSLTNGDGPTPRRVAEGFSFTALTARGVVACGLTREGKGYCWGQTVTGQFATPQPVGDQFTFSALAAGGHPVLGTHVCGYDTAGYVRCWGENTGGNVGDGTTISPRVSPTIVIGSGQPAWFSDRLAAWYPFDGSARDSSGQGRHADVVGAQLTTDRKGKPNAAYAFDGATTWIASRDAFFDIGAPAYTVSLWFRPQSQLARRPSSPGGGYSLLVLSPHFGGLALSYLHPNGPCSTDLCLFAGNGGTGWELWHGEPVPSSGLGGAWHHLAMVVDGKSHKIYVDGLLAWQGIAAEKPASKIHSLLIGTAFPAVNGENFAGSLDEVSVWTRALSAAEITWLAGS